MDPAPLRGVDTDVTPIVLAAVEHARARTGRMVDVLAPATAVTCADPDALAAVVDQLLANALAFSSADSTVLVTIDCSNEGLLLMVSDDGVGMTDAETLRCFERGWRGTGETAGDGLGLYMVRSLVEGMGGRITAGSRPGAGSTFLVTFLDRAPKIAPSTTTAPRATVRS